MWHAWEMRNAFRILVRNLNGRDNLEGRPRCTCKVAVETDIKETGCDIRVSQGRKQVSEYQLLKDSAPWSYLH
jgi:hypothetical protein